MSARYRAARAVEAHARAAIRDARTWEWPAELFRIDLSDADQLWSALCPLPAVYAPLTRAEARAVWTAEAIRMGCDVEES